MTTILDFAPGSLNADRADYIAKDFVASCRAPAIVLDDRKKGALVIRDTICDKRGWFQAIAFSGSGIIPDWHNVFHSEEDFTSFLGVWFDYATDQES